MSQVLIERRSERIKPFFSHVAETVELERFERHPNPARQNAAIVEKANRLAEMIQELDDQDRDAVLAVIRHETSVLLIACMTQATLLRIKKNAGISTSTPPE